ncbi:MAG: hypothetical protein JWP94_480 [Mucilaginibacter sp.]|nr:hypothetical protein [Mucilaginibacter sp.]
MYEQFIELTNQIFWEGYAEQLAQEDPEKFILELNEFMNTYQCRQWKIKSFYW